MHATLFNTSYLLLDTELTRSRMGTWTMCCHATPLGRAWFRGMHAHPPQQHATDPEGLVPGSAYPRGAPWPMSSACSITNVYLITCAGSRAVRRWLQTVRCSSHP